MEEKHCRADTTDPTERLEDMIYDGKEQVFQCVKVSGVLTSTMNGEVSDIFDIGLKNSIGFLGLEIWDELLLS